LIVRLRRLTRLLALSLILTLVVGHGSSVAAAICRHQDAHEHALARQSSDAGVAAVPLAEEAAAASSKKAGQSPSSAIHWPADLLPATLPVVPLRTVEPVRLRPASQIPLASSSVPPLLEPPTA
jgi:hypothetical protein